MLEIDNYIENLIDKLKAAFGDRLLYIGLQGSYLRGEATEHSDIDIMAVIDGLSVDDLGAYREALIEVGDYYKSCSFICGKSDLENWNPLEICHLLHTTKDYFGELKGLVPEYSMEDERNYVKLCLNNLYHELCHRYIHASREHNAERLPTTVKQVFYILQHLHYLETGDFVQTKRELLERLQGMDREVLEMSMAVQSDDFDINKAFALLFEWCRRAMRGCSNGISYARSRIAGVIIKHG